MNEAVVKFCQFSTCEVHKLRSSEAWEAFFEFLARMFAIHMCRGLGVLFYHPYRLFAYSTRGHSGSILNIGSNSSLSISDSSFHIFLLFLGSQIFLGLRHLGTFLIRNKQEETGQSRIYYLFVRFVYFSKSCNFFFLSQERQEQSPC